MVGRSFVIHPSAGKTSMLVLCETVADIDTLHRVRVGTHGVPTKLDKLYI